MWGDFNNSPPQISGLSAGELFYEKEKANKDCLAEQVFASGPYNSWHLDTEESFTGIVSGALSGISLGQIMLFSLVQN